jgi:opacity protein-like surface antigen
MRLPVAATALAAALCATPALAQGVADQPSTYVQVNLGSGLGGNADVSVAAGAGSASGGIDLKAGLFGSAAVGYSMANGLAAEAEVLYADNDGDTDNDGGVKSSTRTWGVMANVMYAIAPVGPFVPYIGAGVGYGRVTIKLDDVKDDDSGLMWQLRAGVSGAIDPQTKWDLGYRYLRVPDYKVSGSATLDGTTYNGSVKVETDVHVLSVGLRRKF